MYKIKAKDRLNLLVLLFDDNKYILLTVTEEYHCHTTITRINRKSHQKIIFYSITKKDKVGDGL